MVKGSDNICKQQRHRKQVRQMAVGLLLIAVGAVTFLVARNAHRDADAEEEQSALMVEHKRLLRSEIPEIPQMSYREMFADANDVQLRAAKNNGIQHPEDVIDPAQCGDLELVESNGLYVVDTLRHSKPYLVGKAVLLLDYIGMRFQEVMAEEYPEVHVRPIVTSMLRSRDEVRQLRRVNRNATENSCHVYGTTLDISYTRFMREDSVVVSDPYLKDVLAKTLYELRYEGLCFVKYERRHPCFHITVKSNDYHGNLKAEVVQYPKPGVYVAKTIEESKKAEKIATKAPSVKVKREKKNQQASGQVKASPKKGARKIEKETVAAPTKRKAAQPGNYVMF